MERSQKRCRPANPARRDPRCARSRTHRLASEARLKQRTSGGMIFLPADNVESKCAILISAMISFKISRARDLETKRFRDQEISRPRDFETKIGDQTMMHRLSREENQPSVRRPAFSKAEAIAMSAMISRRGGEGRGLVHSAAKAAESSTPQRRPRNSPRENGITESSRHGSRC